MQFLTKGLHDVSESSEDVHMDKWHFWFVDERCVPLTHADSNYHAAATQLFIKVRLSWRHIGTVPLACPPTLAGAVPVGVGYTPWVSCRHPRVC